MTCFFAVSLDMEPLANDMHMALARPGAVITRQFGNTGLGLGGRDEVFDDAGWHLADRTKYPRR